MISMNLKLNQPTKNLFMLTPKNEIVATEKLWQAPINRLTFPNCIIVYQALDMYTQSKVEKNNICLLNDLCTIIMIMYHI